MDEFFTATEGLDEDLADLGELGRLRRRRRRRLRARNAPIAVGPAPEVAPEATEVEGLDEDIFIDGLGRVIRRPRPNRPARNRRPVIRQLGRRPRPVRPAPAPPPTAPSAGFQTVNHPHPQRIAAPDQPLQVIPKEVRELQQLPPNSPEAIEAGRVIASQYPRWFDGRTNASYFRNYMLTYLDPHIAGLGNEQAAQQASQQQAGQQQAGQQQAGQQQAGQQQTAKRNTWLWIALAGGALAALYFFKKG